MIACEICSATERKDLFLKDGYTFVECSGCRHIFVPFERSNKELFQLYEKNFFSEGGYADYESDKPILQKNFSRFINALKPYHPNGRLFEVGCAYGFFLELAQKHWQAEGVDIHEGAVESARERLGVKAACGDFLTMPIPENSFDLVTMWDTIEHLRNPADYIEKSAGILKPGGILALTTGDVRSLLARVQGKGWRMYYPPFHLHYFSKTTIEKLLKKFGFRVEKIQMVGFHRSLEMMLYRSLYDRKSRFSQGIYRTAKKVGLAGRNDLYVNLFDIMLVVASKEGRA